MLVRVMNGLGDAIYHRPFVHALASRRPVWIETRWPELFSDLRFRSGEPQGQVIRPRYDSKTLLFRNILQAIEAHFPPDAREPWSFDLPAFPKPESLGRYAVIRPVTLRGAFFGPARNPLPEYISRAAALLRRAGYRTVGVSNVRPGREWFDGDPPDVDVARWCGELSIPDLMALVRGAALVVGGPGWQVPAALAYRVPVVVIYGGAGKANRPDRLTDPRIDCRRFAWVAPDRFCMACQGVRHECDKTISDFEDRFMAALQRCSGRSSS